MATARDVAAYILQKSGPMTAMKLQKLVYYSQAWSIVWDDDSIFDEEIEAWKNGPVVRDLFEAHRGRFRVSEISQGDENKISPAVADTIEMVLNFYGDKSAQWLSDLTHMEDPWKKAWESGPNSIITKESLSEYYSSIEPPSEQKG